MVIRIIIEGGSLQNNNDTTDEKTIQTYDGSEVLREELKKFFTKVLGVSNISVIVNYEGSNKNAAKVFVAQPEEDYLYTDLDDIPENRAEWFTKMEKDGIIIQDERKQNVFFWIQEMEAWFLKQPKCIEAWAAVRSIEIKKSIDSDPLIAGKDIEHLSLKASKIMKVIFKRHLKSTKKGKDGKPLKVEYGKLRVAPRLIIKIKTMEDNIYKTHMVYIDYPMNSLNLKEMEDNINSLEVNLGDVVIVDCQGMDYICSSGLRVFLGLYKMIAQKGGKLIIRNLQPLVKNVFDMSGFSQIFNIE